MVDEHEIEAWVSEHVEPTGPFEPLRPQPWAAVYRVPVRGGAVWLKLCEPVQAFEPRLTAALAERHPALLPEVLALDAERGRLLLADAGTPVGFDGDLRPWLAVLPRYAELQRAETVRRDEHLDAGVPDRRLASFPAAYDALLARDLPLDDAGTARLRAFAPRLAELCAELAAHGPEETIEHADLHGANVYERAGAFAILDWGDACVSHPFLTFFVAFLHLDPANPVPDRLRDAYLEPWGRPGELRETFELAQRLGLFAHVFKQLLVFDAYQGVEGVDFTDELRGLLERGLAVAG